MIHVQFKADVGSLERKALPEGIRSTSAIDIVVTMKRGISNYF